MSAGVKRFPIPIFNDKAVVIEAEFPLSEEDWTQFMTVLTLYKLTLVREATDGVQ